MSWIERAKVGDKVTPRKGVWRNLSEDCLAFDGVPKAGTVYAISGMQPYEYGIVFSLADFPDDYWFFATAFKPVKNTVTQVEALKRICLNTPETVQ
tara:strand:- start:35884 stop:36171 length:288 start_codon:yes stop_codon:yes gene_type:complete